LGANWTEGDLTIVLVSGVGWGGLNTVGTGAVQILAFQTSS